MIDAQLDHRWALCGCLNILGSSESSALVLDDWGQVLRTLPAEQRAKRQAIFDERLARSPTE